VAHDCGLIINPDGLRRCIEGNVVQGAKCRLSEVGDNRFNNDPASARSMFMAAATVSTRAPPGGSGSSKPNTSGPSSRVPTSGITEPPLQ
jgi:hypothetical protein